MRTRLGNAGFSIIELAVIIAIVGVLANIIILQGESAMAKARDRQRFADMHTLQLAISQYVADHDGLPPGVTNAGVIAGGNMIGVGQPIDAALKPYISGRVPKDPRHDGVVYYYAYDPAHAIGPPPDCTQGGSTGVMAIETLETYSATAFSGFNATCTGTDQKINLSYWNVTIGPRSL